MSPALQYHIDHQILSITINRPQALNAINQDVMDGLRSIFIEGKLDLDDVRCIIISGAGDKAFAAGADIAEFSSFNASQGEELSRRGHEVFNAIESFSIPVIAMIKGYALGGGCELAMACHIRIAEDCAKFGQPEVNLGIVPGYGGSQRLIRYVGRSKGLEMLLTGEMIDAHTAFALGLVSDVVNSGEGMKYAVELAQKICTKSPLVVKRLINLANQQSESDGLSQEIKLFGQSFDSIDLKEGVQAFFEKRKPNFIGK